MVRVNIGDIFEIPLADGRKAYGQYLLRDKHGPMIQVFDIISDKNITFEQLEQAKPLFRPIFTGLFAAIKTGLWKKIGHLPVKEFVYPNFIGTNYDHKTGKASIWFLWNGERDLALGEKLPDGYKMLEYDMVWDPYSVIRRVETGEYPFPYQELIHNNVFIPKTK